MKRNEWWIAPATVLAFFLCGAYGRAAPDCRALEWRSVSTADAACVAAEGGTLSVVTGHTTPYPGITLLAAGDRWDLREHFSVAVEVTNTGSRTVTVHLRVDNPGADGAKSCVNGQIALRPGATETLRANLNPTPWRLTKPLQLVGMRAAPGNQEDFDPSNVTQVLIFVVKPGTDHAFEVTRLRAEGSVKTLDADRFLPFIDELGQFIHAEWPGKAASVEDMKSRIAAEDADLAALPGPPGLDAYGGWKDGPRLAASGFFRVEKIDGMWWLVDPEGHLFWSHGVDCVRMSNATPLSDRETYFRDLPAADSPLGAFYGRGSWAPHGFYQGRGSYRTYDFGRANLFKKYGEEWETVTAALIHRRLRSWGLNTIANWSDSKVYLLRRTPYVGTISFESRPIEGSGGYWGKFPDVFDTSFRELLRRRLEAERGSSIGDPWCLGYFVHNELSWGDELSLALGTLASPPDQPAKKAFVAALEARYGDIGRLNSAWGTSHASWDALLQDRQPPDQGRALEDLGAFTTRIAETYFETIREELKLAAPDQLYMGCRFAWANDRVVRAAARFCDVVSFNRYDRSVEDFRLPEGVDKPAIVGEFHFGALDRGMFHTGLKPTASQEDRAASYRDYVSGALRNPHIVGTHWFQYQDQATTGRGDGENYQIGLVDVCDAPYPETIAAVREVGYAIPSIRREGRIVRDAFRASPEPPWKWIRENPENHGADAGGLWIRLEPGGLMGGGRDARNILVRPMPAGTRSISVEVETRHASQFEQAGLIVYRDDDNYVKLVQELVDGKTWIVLVLEVGARPDVLAKVPPPEGSTRLGIDIAEKAVPGSGWTLRALAWGDSGQVTGVGEEVVIPGDVAPRIGVFTQSGQAGADRRARFRDFVIASKPCGLRKDGNGAPKRPER